MNVHMDGFIWDAGERWRRVIKDFGSSCLVIVPSKFDFPAKNKAGMIPKINIEKHCFHQHNINWIIIFYTLVPKTAASCADNTSWETEISKLPVCHGRIQAAGPIISALLQL